ncbi:MAG: PKD domain-containing protein, partial [Catalinimonas sp.]
MQPLDVQTAYDCNQRYLIVSNFNSRKVTSLAFDTSFEDPPVMHDITPPGGLLGPPTRLTLTFQKNHWELLLQMRDQGLYAYTYNNLSELPVDSRLVIPPNVDNYRDVFGFELIRADSAYYGVAISRYNWLHGFRFETDCDASVRFSDQPSPSVSYLAAGRQDYLVEVTDTLGNVRRRHDSLVIETSPQADFTSGPTCTNTIQFLEASCYREGAVAFSWDFGDGTAATDATPTHTYASEGAFDVRLIVTDATGASDTLSKNVSTAEPIPDFTTDGVRCSQGATPFSDLTTTLPGDRVQSWRWTFGDGTISNEQHPEHVYDAPGDYTVTLTVTGLSGCEVSTSKGISVQPGPDVAFSAENFCSGDAVAFEDLTTFATGTDFVSREWDFGDGTTSNQIAPTHVYADTGIYTVTLSVLNDVGCENRTTREVRIYAPPAADFGWRVPALAEDSVPFFDQSTAVGQQVVGWAWDFGDGGADTRQNPVYFYEAPGTYEVRLIITTDQGCRDTVTQSVEVALKCPEVTFFLSTPEIGVNQPLVATPQTSSEAVRLTWDFCAGDLGLPPTGVVGPVLPDALDRPSEPAVVQANDTTWYAFSADNGGNLFRSRLDGDLLPTTWDFVGNPSGRLADVRDITVFREDTAWYGLAVNRNNDRLVRIDFGAELANDDVPPTAQDVTTLAFRPEHITLQRDLDSLYLFVVGNSSNQIQRLRFGTSVLNAPAADLISSSTIGTDQGLRDLALVQECNEWWGVLLSNSVLTYRVRFGRSLGDAPQVNNLTNRVRDENGDVLLLDNPRSVGLLTDGGETYALIHGQSGQTYRLDFGTTITTESVRGERLGDLSVLNNIEGAAYVKRRSDWLGLALDRSNKRAYQVRFLNPCSATPQVDTTGGPATVSYAAGGTYTIT